MAFATPLYPQALRNVRENRGRERRCSGDFPDSMARLPFGFWDFAVCSCLGLSVSVCVFSVVSVWFWIRVRFFVYLLLFFCLRSWMWVRVFVCVSESRSVWLIVVLLYGTEPESVCLPRPVWETIKISVSVRVCFWVWVRACVFVCEYLVFAFIRTCLQVWIKVCVFIYGCGFVSACI